jgi:outer membrane protein OmpA-like peptidoglycan-associated protein
MAVSLEGVRLQVPDHIEQHPEILRLDIAGHTDSRGQRSTNIELSMRRAAAVKRWLIEHGAAAERTSQGLGPDQPAREQRDERRRAP